MEFNTRAILAAYTGYLPLRDKANLGEFQQARDKLLEGLHIARGTGEDGRAQKVLKARLPPELVSEIDLDKLENMAPAQRLNWIDSFVNQHGETLELPDLSIGATHIPWYQSKRNTLVTQDLIYFYLARDKGEAQEIKKALGLAADADPSTCILKIEQTFPGLVAEIERANVRGMDSRTSINWVKQFVEQQGDRIRMPRDGHLNNFATRVNDWF